MASAKKKSRQDAPPSGDAQTKAKTGAAAKQSASAAGATAPADKQQGEATLPSGAPLAPASPEERDLAIYTSFAGKFWKGPARRKAWLLTGGVATFIIFNLIVQIGINRWNAYFFNALERKDLATATTAISCSSASP